MKVDPKKASIFGRGYVAFALAVILLSILIFVSLFPLSANREPPSWSQMKSAVFIGLSRPAYLTAVLWIFHLQWLNHGRFLKKFMTRQFFTVVARLSYSTYLVFAIVAAQFISSMQDPLYLTYNEMFWQMTYEIVASFLVAFLFYMFIERPAANLIFGIKKDVN